MNAKHTSADYTTICARSYMKPSHFAAPRSGDEAVWLPSATALFRTGGSQVTPRWGHLVPVVVVIVLALGLIARVYV